MKILKDKRGSIAIEASIVFPVLVLVILGIADLSKTIIDKERLDRLSYSLSSLIREKSFFKNGILTSDDSDNLYDVAMILSDNYIAEKDNLGIVFEVMTFAKGNQKILEKIDKFTYGIECEIDDFEEFEELSYKNKSGEWSQLNRVSVCLKTSALLNPSSKFIDLISSSISISRQ